MMNKSVFIYMLRLIMKPWLWFFRQIIRDDKLVLFMHHHTQGYGGNPKYIAHALHELCPQLNLVWLGEATDIPPWIKVYKPHVLNIFYFHIKAKVWVDDETKPRYLSKFKDQFYIQTWHGDRGFKHIKYQYQIKPLYMLEENQCDVFVCGSMHAVDKYPKAFRTSANMILQGMPGNDRFIKGISYAQQLKIKYGFSNHKICLIAPTLTNQGLEYMNSAMMTLLKKTLEEATDQSWIVAYRAHYRNFTSPSIKSMQAIPDVYDVLDMCDFLISDYSSIIGDFCVQDKPWIIYTPSMIQERPNHHKLSQSHYYKYHDFSELLNQIDVILQTDFKELNREILKAYGTYESGEASIHLARLIYEHTCKS